MLPESRGHDQVRGRAVIDVLAGMAFSFDQSIVALHAQHDIRPGFITPRRFRQVAAGANHARVSAGFTEAVSIQMQGVVKLPSGEDIPCSSSRWCRKVLTIVVLAGFIGNRGRHARSACRTRRLIGF
jgi:hypothetical protein